MATAADSHKLGMGLLDFFQSNKSKRSLKVLQQLTEIVATSTATSSSGLKVTGLKRVRTSDEDSDDDDDKNDSRGGSTARSQSSQPSPSQ